MKAYFDRHGDVWVQVMPGRYRVAQSDSHARRLADSGQGGSTLHTVEALYGPLQPWEDDSEEKASG